MRLSTKVRALREAAKELGEILEARFGFDGGEHRTLAELAPRYGVGSETRRQIEADALTSLRRIPYIRQLSGHVDRFGRFLFGTTGQFGRSVLRQFDSWRAGAECQFAYWCGHCAYFANSSDYVAASRLDQSVPVVCAKCSGVVYQTSGGRR